MLQAEQKLKGGMGLLSFITGGPKYDDASDLYQQAANHFKLAKDWQGAANCHLQCAYCAKKTGSATDEANQLMEAGNILKKVSSQQAAEQYEKAVAIFSTSGRFQQSGKLLLSIAEMYEAQHFQSREVADYYRRAAEMFNLDDYGKSNYSKCNLKLAEHSARLDQLEEAIAIFEQEGEKALQNSLTLYGAKEHFFRAGILHMVMGDSVTVNLAVEKYKQLDPRFSSSREGELLTDLAEAFENKDPDLFTSKLGEYDRITPIDAWKAEFLLRVKQSMRGDYLDDVDLT